MEKRFEVVGIGNAIVDIMANVEDDFLNQHLLKKGSMRLVDNNLSSRICGCIEIVENNSGGSVANTIAGLACLENRVAFMGKISEDERGRAFEDSLKQLGVHFSTKKSKGGHPTGHCVVLITPDAQRTMNTCLGVAGNIGPEDMDEQILKDTKITFMEGYLWESTPAERAAYRAIGITKKYGGKCALSLSDSFCVQRHREKFMALAKEKIDFIFANQDEIKALFESDSLKDAIKKCGQMGKIFAITRSDKGSIIVQGKKQANIDTHIPQKIMDTTGAGDLYAAGFMHAYLKGHSLEACGKAGSIVAAEAISHFGARPQAPLLDLLRQKGY